MRKSASKLPQRPAVPIVTRRALTLAREVEILRRFTVCAGCGTRMTCRADYDYDHEIPLALGGADESGNLRPYCRAVCHPLKTAQDVKAVAKAKRLAGETCAGEARRPILKRRDYVWPTRAWPKRHLKGRPIPVPTR